MLMRRLSLRAIPFAALLSAAIALSPGTGLAQGFVTGQCVPVLSNSDGQFSGSYGTWMLDWSGIPIPAVISAPASSPPWGSVIPNTAARWTYFRDPNWAQTLGDFRTGPTRDPRTATVYRFRRTLISFDRSHVASAVIRITADNGYFLWVDGRGIGGSFTPGTRKWNKDPVNGWKTFDTWNVIGAIGSGPGEFTIVVDVADFGGFAGFLLDGTFCAQPGYTLTVNT